MALVKIIYTDGSEESFDDSKDQGSNEVKIYETVIVIREYDGHEIIIPINLIKRIDYFKRNI